MKYLYILLALTGLALLVVPSVRYFSGSGSEEHMKMLMFIGTLLWFSGAIPWLGKKKTSAAHEKD